MRRISRTIITPAMVVFLAVMLLVGISFITSRNNANEEAENTVGSYAQQTEDSIKDRLNIFGETLHAGLGLLASDPNITNQQWQKFIETSAVIERQSGGQGIAYARVVSKSDLPTFVADSQTRVIPTYHVYPEGERDIYVPILFLAPYRDTNAQFFGFDLFTEQTRRKALVSARDTGKIALSDTIQSSLDKTPEGRAFVMYAPQYKAGMPIETIEQRQAAISGYTYVGFRVNKFMSTIISKQNNPNISFSVVIDDSRNDLYRSPNYDQVMGAKHKTRTNSIEIGSTTVHLTYAYNADKILPKHVSERPLRTLGFGIIVALLISYTVLLVLRSKANDLLLEQERGINDAKDNLLSLASHQLRTPATGVKQYLGLIIQGFAGDVSPRQHRILAKAYASNERQLKIINDILYLARLGSGRIVLTKSAFSISQLVRDVVRELDHDIKEKQHKVTLKIPKKERRFIGDEHMIRMAVENLLTNALKYTHKKGKIEVVVTYGKQLKIAVKDSGVGIPDDQRERMFEQFERIDNELSIEVGGTGIGLYVVKNIANSHNGHVEVQSNVDEGSTFTLVLPYGTFDESTRSVM